MWLLSASTRQSHSQFRIMQLYILYSQSYFRVNNKPELHVLYAPKFLQKFWLKKGFNQLSWLQCFLKRQKAESLMKLLCIHIKMFQKCTALTYIKGTLVALWNQGVKMYSLYDFSLMGCQLSRQLQYKARQVFNLQRKKSKENKFSY